MNIYIHKFSKIFLASSLPASWKMWYMVLVFLMPAGEYKTCAQLVEILNRDSIAGHPAIYDADSAVLSWYKPEVPGAGYDHVVALASKFIKEGVPVEPRTGEKMYFVTCCFHGPHMDNDTGAPGGIVAEDWMHNPACFFAGAVIGLAKGYRVYSGDDAYLDVVKEMLDYQLANGTTPDDWPWANVPYASSDPFEKIYKGAVRWESDGMRGDGLHGIEPDKIGELGYAYLVFYEITEDEKYLAAAIHCADALAGHVREIPGDLAPFTTAEIMKSPWPFRVNARTGKVISEYTSNVVESIKLLDELIRISDRIILDEERQEAYGKARNIAWKWLYSKSGPMKTYIWNGYFEDIPNDPDRSNRVQITPLETARYLIQNPDLDPDMEMTVPALIKWVSSVFGTEGLDAIKEQTWCYEPMGSHTARYASLCALWYERTRDDWYKEQARRFFNVASYMTDENGVVRVGPNWPGSWFSDGYGDYIRHYMDGLGAVPEWVPVETDHLVKSTSVIQTVDYGDNLITYASFDGNSREVLRLRKKPVKILAGNTELSETSDPNTNGWLWVDLDKGGIVKLSKMGERKVSIYFND